MEEIIKVENLTHTYGIGTPFERSAVKDMNLSVYRGELLGLTVPDTVALLRELRANGLDVPVDALTVEECADAIMNVYR